MPRVPKAPERVHPMYVRVPWDLYTQVWDKAQAEQVDIKTIVLRALQNEVALAGQKEE